MSKFTDRLWRDIVREQGADLRQMDPPSARPQSRWFGHRLLAGTGLVGVAGVGATLAIVLSASGASPAFAVTRNHDGSYSARVLSWTAIPQANARLQALHVRAQFVQVQSGCTAAPAAVVMARAVAAGDKGPVTMSLAKIAPRQIPAGRTLVVPAIRMGRVIRFAPGQTVDAQAVPSCLPLRPPCGSTRVFTGPAGVAAVPALPAGAATGTSTTGTGTTTTDTGTTTTDTGTTTTGTGTSTTSASAPPGAVTAAAPGKVWTVTCAPPPCGVVSVHSGSAPILAPGGPSTTGTGTTATGTGTTTTGTGTTTTGTGTETTAGPVLSPAQVPKEVRFKDLSPQQRARIQVLRARIAKIQAVRGAALGCGPVAVQGTTGAVGPAGLTGPAGAQSDRATAHRAVSHAARATTKQTKRAAQAKQAKRAAQAKQTKHAKRR